MLEGVSAQRWLHGLTTLRNIESEYAQFALKRVFNLQMLFANGFAVVLLVINEHSDSLAVAPSTFASHYFAPAGNARKTSAAATRPLVICSVVKLSRGDCNTATMTETI